MQILIDLSDAQIETVLQRAKERGLSSSEVICQAVTKGLALSGDREGPDWISQYAGLWARTNPDGVMDGMEYQDKLRSEWER